MVCHTEDWSLLCYPTINRDQGNGSKYCSLVVITLAKLVAFTFGSSLPVIGSNCGVVFIDGNSEITWRLLVVVVVSYLWPPAPPRPNFSSCLAFTFDSSLVVIGSNL